MFYCLLGRLGVYGQAVAPAHAQRIQAARDGVIAVSERSIGVIEQGPNTHPAIKGFWQWISPAYYNSRPPYCAAYVYNAFRVYGLKPAVKTPAMAASWYSESRIIWRYNPHGNERRQREPPKGSLVLYRVGGRISHVGLLARERSRSEERFTVNEGNTSPRGAVGPQGQLGAVDREGDGIYRKARPPASIYVIVDWIPTTVSIAP